MHEIPKSWKISVLTYDNLKQFYIRTSFSIGRENTEFGGRIGGAIGFSMRLGNCNVLVVVRTAGCKRLVMEVLLKRAKSARGGEREVKVGLLMEGGCITVVVNCGLAA
jgi:hypothetical protein